jgi:hypothetical protein
MLRKLHVLNYQQASRWLFSISIFFVSSHSLLADEGHSRQCQLKVVPRFQAIDNRNYCRHMAL